MNRSPATYQINRTHTAFAIVVLVVLFATILTPAIQPLQDLRFAFIWTIGLGGIVTIWGAASIWKASSTDFWLGRAFASLLIGFGFGGCAWLAGLCASLILNVTLDHSTPRQRVMRIEKKEIHTTKGSDSFHLLSRDVNDAQYSDLKVGREFFNRKFAGECIRVTTRAGGLGVERVERVE